ncbi:MAG: hypothetical protein ACRDV7_11975 [Acidimicrobiia bacterium]
MLPARVLTGGLIALMLVVGAACGGDDDDDDTASADATPSSTATNQNDEFPEYIGLSVEDATAKAEIDGRPARVVEVDGEPQAVTMDFIEERLNFVVVDGKVTAVTTG